jgi:hypothetical protein
MYLTPPDDLCYAQHRTGLVEITTDSSAVLRSC